MAKPKLVAENEKSTIAKIGELGLTDEQVKLVCDVYRPQTPPTVEDLIRDLRLDSGALFFATYGLNRFREEVGNPKDDGAGLDELAHRVWAGALELAARFEAGDVVDGAS